MSSRQRRWQIKQQQNNRCTTCGKPRSDSPYAAYCLHCGLRRLKRDRKRRGSKWRRGGPGRPPVTERGPRATDVPVQEFVEQPSTMQENLREVNETNE